MKVAYKSKWKPNSENRQYWEEVMVGRTITGLGFVDGRIDNFTLDSGEIMYLNPSQLLFIKTEEETEEKEEKETENGHENL